VANDAKKFKEEIVVAVTTSLKQKLSQPELEAVLAHDLSHVNNRDMLVITIASFLSKIAFFLVRNMLFFGVGENRDRKNRGAAIIVFVVSLVEWIISMDVYSKIKWYFFIIKKKISKCCLTF